MNEALGTPDGSAELNDSLHALYTALDLGITLPGLLGRGEVTVMHRLWCCSFWLTAPQVLVHLLGEERRERGHNLHRMYTRCFECRGKCVRCVWCETGQDLYKDMQACCDCCVQLVVKGVVRILILSWLAARQGRAVHMCGDAWLAALVCVAVQSLLA